MNHLSFRLGDAVIIKASGETAEVVSRAEHATAEPSYYLRYCRADGHAVEQWWSQSALQAAEVKVSNDTGQVRQLKDGCAMSPQAPRLPHVVAAALADKLRSRTNFLANLNEALLDININRNSAEKQIEETLAEIAALEAALAGN